MKTNHHRWRMALGFLLGSGLLAQAQSYSIDSFTIDGGGGTSSGGNYSLSGTIGQPDAGRMSGGNFSLDGGFWSTVSVVTVPGAPTVTITFSTNNTVILSWPATSAGFTVQQNNNLALVNGWSNLGTAPVLDGDKYKVTVTLAAGSNFFRLRK